MLAWCWRRFPGVQETPFEIVGMGTPFEIVGMAFGIVALIYG